MTIGPRLISALLLTGLLGVVYWLMPNLEPAALGASTPDRIALFFTAIFAFFLAYLIVQENPDFSWAYWKFEHAQPRQHGLRSSWDCCSVWTISPLSGFLARFAAKPDVGCYDASGGRL